MTPSQAVRFSRAAGCVFLVSTLIFGLFGLWQGARASVGQVGDLGSGEAQDGPVSIDLQGIHYQEILTGSALLLRPTKTPTSSISPTKTPTKTLTNSPSTTVLPSSTPTMRPTRTPIGGPSPTPSPTKTSTLSPTPTHTPTKTTTISPTPSQTPTGTLTTSTTPTLTPTSTQTQPGVGLVAHWKFDETAGTSAFDSSGNNFTATLVGGPTWTGGKVGGALNFDGSNDRVDAVDDPLDITGSLTIATWIYHANNSQAHHIASKNQLNVACPWQLAILTTNKLRSYTRGNGLNQSIDSNDSVSINAWHHIAFVRDAATSKATFYIDGIQDSGGWKSYSPVRVVASGVTAKVASRGDGSSNYFPGTIDDLRIYNRPLTGEEIFDLYQEGSGDEIDVSITSPANGGTVAGTIGVEVSATAETEISRVELRKNGVLFGADALEPFTFYWSTALEPNGSTSLTATAFDVSGNSVSSQPVNVNVNNPPVTTRPNIVVVLTDDQRWDTMQYMPRINARLFADSIRFTNAVAAVPLCCPSRASFLTGLYSFHHGVIDNKPPYGAPVFDDTSTIATWLDGLGYRTGLFGKYMNIYSEIAPYVPPGWDQWSAFVTDNGNYYNYDLVENGTIESYGNQPEDYSTDVIAGKAVQFINSTSPNVPVFVYMAPFAPHFNLSSPAMDSLPEPGPGDSGAYASLDPWRPPSYNETDVSDKPLWVRKLALLSLQDIDTGDAFRIKQLESLLAVDRAIEDLIDTLIAAGRYDNTVFVFLSDNGLSWGEHRWNWKKWCAYEECVRIPFWVRVPGVTGRDEGALVNDADLAPTLAELAGAHPSLGPDGSPLDGISLVDLIEDPLAPWRTETYTEYIGPFKFNNTNLLFREIRTESYMYAELINGEREFYDLALDPYQMLNRVAEPFYAQIIDGLQKALHVLIGQ